MSGPTKAVGVVVVDDNPLLCASMERWLTEARGFRCLGCAADGRGARELIDLALPDFVLLDLDLPGTDSGALLRWIVAAHPSVRVVMLSGLADQKSIEDCLYNGATGYIVKDESLPSILDLLQRAAGGETILSPLAAATLRAPQPLTPPRHAAYRG